MSHKCTQCKKIFYYPPFAILRIIPKDVNLCGLKCFNAFLEKSDYKITYVAPIYKEERDANSRDTEKTKKAISR